MPSSFFLLARFFLRVDNVLFRIHDVRLYHEFASSEVLRETKGKEATYSEVKKVGASPCLALQHTDDGCVVDHSAYPASAQMI